MAFILPHPLLSFPLATKSLYKENPLYSHLLDQIKDGNNWYWGAK